MKSKHHVGLREHEIQRQILEWLELKHIFHWRNNVGAMKTLRGFIRFGTPGSPDIFALWNGVLWGIEVKNEKGRLSILQATFGARLAAAGGNYLVARSLDDVMVKL